MEEFIASIYNYVYIITIAILTLSYLPNYLHKKELAHNGRMKTDNAIVLLIIIILFIGLRPLNEQYFQDMQAYSYVLRKNAYTIYVFDKETNNVIFDNFIIWFASNRYSQRLFFILMSILYFGTMYWGIKRLFPNDIRIAFLTYLAGFSTFSYGVNGLKAGVAASIFILALSFKDRKIICIILMLISLGFHHSMTVPIAAVASAYLIKNAKLFYWLWGICLLMSVFHISYFQNRFAGMTDDHGATYLLATYETTIASIRFRPDFIIYSLFPILIGYKYEFKNNIKLSKNYSFLIHFYIAANAIWLLCMYASYNNRIAYLSWFIYPVVLIYPYLDKLNTDPLRFQKLGKVVKYHLYFTLFMTIVYYGIFGLGHA